MKGSIYNKQFKMGGFQSHLHLDASVAQAFRFCDSPPSLASSKASEASNESLTKFFPNMQQGVSVVQEIHWCFNRWTAGLQSDSFSITNSTRMRRKSSCDCDVVASENLRCPPL